MIHAQPIQNLVEGVFQSTRKAFLVKRQWEKGILQEIQECETLADFVQLCETTEDTGTINLCVNFSAEFIKLLMWEAGEATIG